MSRDITAFFKPQPTKRKASDLPTEATTPPKAADSPDPGSPPPAKKVATENALSPEQRERVRKQQYEVWVCDKAA